MYERSLIELRNISIHTRNLEWSCFAMENILTSWKIVVANFDVFDRPDRLELAPVHFLRFAELSERRHELFPARKDNKKSIMYLHRLHIIDVRS